MKNGLSFSQIVASFVSTSVGCRYFGNKLSPHFDAMSLVAQTPWKASLLHKCLRRLLKIYWPMKVSNEEIRRQARTCTIREQTRRRRWRWIGHVLCMNNEQNPRIALTWAPEGKRSRGRPKVTLGRTVEGESQKMGFATWSEAVTAARDSGLKETSERSYSPRGNN